MKSRLYRTAQRSCCPLLDLFLLLASVGALYAQGYRIDTFAGGGFPADGPATQANLAFPHSPGGNVAGITSDKSGNIYFSVQDPYNLVFRLDASGNLTRVAGSGIRGFDGDGGPAISARLFNPSGLAVDDAGDIYIADEGNDRIRKVANRIITTVAGGASISDLKILAFDHIPAIGASLARPGGVAVDSQGTIYVADTDYNRVIAISSGIVTTIAGNGSGGFSGDGGPAISAELSYPTGVALDSVGNLYIADEGNSRIRKVSPLGTITTVVGTGAAGNSGDGGPAISAQLTSPHGVAFDSPGHMYIADIDGGIRMVSAGIITTVLNEFQADDPVGVTLNASGDLYVAEYAPSQVVKFSGGVLTTVAGGGEAPGSEGPAAGIAIDGPRGVAVDANGNVYIAVSADNIVVEVSNGVSKVVAGNGVSASGPDNVPARQSSVASPQAVALDSAGNLYIAERNGNAIRMVTPAGIITTVAGNHSQGFSGDGGPATSALLSHPDAVAVDNAGVLYIADTGNNRVRAVVNGVINTIAGNGSSDYGDDNVAATSATVAAPVGLALDAAGNLYVSEFDNDRVRRISNGIITTVAGSMVNGNTYGLSGDGGYPATRAEMYAPTGLGLDASGNVYFSDYFNGRVRVLKPDAQSCTYSVSPSSIRADYTGGQFEFQVQTGPSCAWDVVLPDVYPFVPATVATVTPFQVPDGGVGPASFSIIIPYVPEEWTIPPSFYVFDTPMTIGDASVQVSRPATNRTIQTIFFVSLPDQSLGTPPFSLAPLPFSSSRLPLTFSSNPLSVCTVSGQTVTLVAAGTCTITAAQPGDANYFPADPVSESFTVTGPPGGPVVFPGGVVPIDGIVATIQPSSWVSIYGSNLASSTATWNGDYPTSLSDVTVTVNGKAAYLWYVSATQINMQAPDDPTIGPVDVVVKNSHGSFITTVTLAYFAPSLNLLDGKHVAGVILTPDGSGHYGNGAYDLVGPSGAFPFYTRPVKAGETVLLYGTGFGLTLPGVPAGKPFSGSAPTASPVWIFLGNGSGAYFQVLSTAVYASGAYQVAFVMPSTGSGDQGIQLLVGGKSYGYGFNNLPNVAITAQ